MGVSWEAVGGRGRSWEAVGGRARSCEVVRGRARSCEVPPAGRLLMLLKPTGCCWRPPTRNSSTPHTGTMEQSPAGLAILEVDPALSIDSDPDYASSGYDTSTHSLTNSVTTYIFENGPPPDGWLTVDCW